MSNHQLELSEVTTGVYWYYLRGLPKKQDSYADFSGCIAPASEWSASEALPIELWKIIPYIDFIDIYVWFCGSIVGDHTSTICLSEGLATTPMPTGSA
jgi:hypothetical protein